MIRTSIAISVFLWMDLSNIYVWACIFVMLGFGAIGFLDDYDKVRKSSHTGVPGRVRLLAEFLIAGGEGWLIVSQTGTALCVPLWNGPALNLGPFYYIFAAFVILGQGNAVNLQDGVAERRGGGGGEMVEVRVGH